MLLTCNSNTLQKRAARSQVKAASFNRLLLRFGHLNKGFAKCKNVYHSLDSDGNEVIDLQELAEGCNKLGFDISSDVIDKVFQATDLDGNKVIDFREFIVVLALLYMISTEVSLSLSFQNCYLHPVLIHCPLLFSQAALA